MVVEVLDRLADLDVPDGHLAAGCLFQTVWNVLDGEDPQRGIGDYDVIYHDPSDLSWDAEDLVIRRAADVFADLPIEVEVRNQARVHLWYEDHFGVPCAPITSCAHAIDRYAAHACRYGIHPGPTGWDLYAPVGFDDLFAFVLRPNPVVAPRHVYETKADRWQSLWPRLQVVPWPDDGEDGSMGRRLGTTERLEIRRPSGRDRSAVIDAVLASREFHHPWVVGPTDAEAFNGWVRRQRSPRYQGFLLWTHDHEPVGIVNVSDMIMGNFRSAHVGYYAFVGHEGKGLMSEGIRWIVRYSFTDLGLHRIEANIQPGNEPSRRMAEACGFRLEGFSPNYLTVDGAWRDHERWAITAEDVADPA